jgi:hypothetical protein
MAPSASTNLYKYHRFPGEIISHAVWLYFRFPLSYRDVEELLFVRGVIMSYEAIRKWCWKFGQATPINCAAGASGLATNGTWKMCFSPSIENDITCGGPLIKTATCWIFLCKAVGTSKRRRNSSASYSRG